MHKTPIGTIDIATYIVFLIAGTVSILFNRRMARGIVEFSVKWYHIRPNETFARVLCVLIGILFFVVNLLSLIGALR